MLTVIGTPIGNLGDISPRARLALDQADLIAAEDTRRAASLLAALGLKPKRMLSYFKDNEKGRIPQLLKKMESGTKVALISDSGMPAVADPGSGLVAAARAAGLKVDIIPGPSAVIHAVAGSGFGGGFVFAGFLPRKGKERRELLARLADSPETVVLYESPFRAAETVADLLAAWGNRPAYLARELTKLHEEWLGPTLESIVAILTTRAEIKGEVVLVIHGKPADAAAPKVKKQKYPQPPKLPLRPLG